MKETSFEEVDATHVQLIKHDDFKTMQEIQISKYNSQVSSFPREFQTIKMNL